MKFQICPIFHYQTSQNPDPSFYSQLTPIALMKRIKREENPLWESHIWRLSKTFLAY